MATFFVPAAESPQQAEDIYIGIARFNEADDSGPRLHTLSWQHQGSEVRAAVGAPLPAAYGTAAEPVMAILDCGDHYRVCTPSRGGLWGSAFRVDKSPGTVATAFGA